MKNITIFHLKIFIFTSVKYYRILQGRVFVMRVVRVLDFGAEGCMFESH